MCCLKNNSNILVVSISVCILLGLTSCEKNRKQASLYHIDSLVSAQVKLLADSKARLYKQATIGAVTDDSTYIPADTIGWNNELAIFRQLHAINKPINKDNYIVDDGLFDPRSNLTVKAFSSRIDLPVRYIRVFYQKSLDSPRKIEALYNDENNLSKTGRLLTMEFQQVKNKNVITSYTVEGGQKMIFGDTVAFHIKGKIIID
jgi:hypothetical protein